MRRKRLTAHYKGYCQGLADVAYAMTKNGDPTQAAYVMGDMGIKLADFVEAGVEPHVVEALREEMELNEAQRSMKPEDFNRFYSEKRKAQ